MRAIFPNRKSCCCPACLSPPPGGRRERKRPSCPAAGGHPQREGEPTVLLVTPDNKVELRVIKTDRAIGDKWLVSDGVRAGDRIIVDGVQKAQPGATVAPSEVVPPTTTAQQQ